MPASMAGMRGGIATPLESSSFLASMLALVRGEMPTPNQLLEVLRRSVPHTLTLVINNTCNLSCRHCYLQSGHDPTSDLRASEWQQVIESALRSDISLLCFSGKEVFANSRSAALIDYACSFRKRVSSNVRIGVITNGTRLLKHEELLNRLPLDYLDVSVDGTRPIHDSLRGIGSYDLMLEGLRIGVRNLGEKLFATTTLNAVNIGHFADLLRELDSHRVCKVGCGAYRALSHTDPSLALSTSSLSHFFDSLDRLRALSFTSLREVIFDMDITVLPFLLAFLRSSWFDLDASQCDHNEEIFVGHQLGNGLKLHFRFRPAPSLIFHSARISSDGRYLTAEDTIDPAYYAAHDLADIRVNQFDFDKTHKLALSHPRLSELVRVFLSTELPLIQEAYGQRIERKRAA